MKTLSDHIKSILALILIVLGFGYFFLCTFGDFEADPQIIIAIVALMTNAVNYFFGSSTGGTKKDETIAELSKKQ